MKPPEDNRTGGNIGRPRMSRRMGVMGQEQVLTSELPKALQIHILFEEELYRILIHWRLAL